MALQALYNADDLCTIVGEREAATVLGCPLPLPVRHFFGKRHSFGLKNRLGVTGGSMDGCIAKIGGKNWIHF